MTETRQEHSDPDRFIGEVMLWVCWDQEPVNSAGVAYDPSGGTIALTDSVGLEPFYLTIAEAERSGRALLAAAAQYRADFGSPS
jgi:hypothetical protein